MAGQQLKASLDGIQRLGDSLWRLADAFASLTTVAAESGEAGNAELAGALSDFAAGWSDKRDQLTKQLQQLSQDAKTAVREYTDTDTTLARGLMNPGAGITRPGVTAPGVTGSGTTGARKG